MDIVPLLVAVFAILPVTAMAAWVWLAMANSNEDLREFVVFGGRQFDE